MAERSRRATTGVSSKGGINSALAQLKELRNSGKKHADVYEIKAEDAVFDVLDDDEYSKLVNKRRNEAGWGVRGVMTSTTYQDGTQAVLWWATTAWGMRTLAKSVTGVKIHTRKTLMTAHQHARVGKRVASPLQVGYTHTAKGYGHQPNSLSTDKKRPAEPQPDKRRTMQRMFAAAAQTSAPAAPKPAAAAPGGDDLLADILGGLDGTSSNASIKPPTRQAKRFVATSCSCR